MKNLRTALAVLLFAGLNLFGAATVHAQWTVFDPTVYGEEIENFGQLYNENQTTLQHLEMAVQQYNMLNSQFQQLNNMSRYAMTGRTPWTQMPFSFNSQGHISGWGTTLASGTYPNAYAALQQSQYQPNFLTNPGATVDQIYRSSLKRSSLDLQNNALESCLANMGDITAMSVQTDPTLDNLIIDSADPSSALQTSTAIAQKTSIADSILAQAQSDANKLSMCQLYLQTAQLQQASNDRAMELQDASNVSQSWSEAAEANGGGNGTLGSSYNRLQTASGVTQ